MDNRVIHIETKIGDWAVSLAFGAQSVPTSAEATSYYVYVENVDSAYQRALKRGAIPLSAPTDRGHAERSAKVRDQSGNVWRLYTFKQPPVNPF